MAFDLSSLTTQQLKRAVALREQIDSLQSQLDQLTGEKNQAAPARFTTSVPKKAAGGKRVMSPEAKAKIAAALRKRWAAKRKAAASTTAAPKKAAK